MKMRDLKISVIGGAGFIGTNVCQILANRQIPFEIIDIKKSRRFPEKSKVADIRNLSALREAVEGQVILHLAAVHRDDVRDKSLYASTNVDGTKNICTVAREKGIGHIVFTSTVAVYGFAPLDTDETGKINPFNEYGRTKYQAEEVLNSWRRGENHRSVMIVRPTVVFGEGNRGNVYNLLTQIASGRFVMVGAGRNRKSMAYIGNISAFLVTCCLNPRQHGLFNYVDAPDFNMNTLVAQVRAKLAGKQGVGMRIPYSLGLLLGYLADFAALVIQRPLSVSSLRIKKFCASTAFNSNKDTLEGFTAPFSLAEGLERTLEAEFIAPDPDQEIFFTE